MASPIAEQLEGIMNQLAVLDADGDPREQIDTLTLLERVKSAVSAAQVRVVSAFAATRRDQLASRSKDPDQARAGIAGEVALAMRTSRHSGGCFVGFARMISTEMPETMKALASGELSEYRARILVRETAWLSLSHRQQIDRDLAGNNAAKLAGLGNRKVEAAVKMAAYNLDPKGAVDRANKAAEDRRVTSRPMPGTMMQLCALLPVVQGVACMAALNLAADTARAKGDLRNRSQVIADTLVERLTGQAKAPDVPITVNLIMSETPHTPAVIAGAGPIPAGTAMHLIGNSRAPRWRRLFQDRKTRRLVTMESTAEFFNDGMAEFTTFRDIYCRTAYCDAPIREIDHIKAKAEGGATSLSNAQGLCQACNLTKQAQGWTARPAMDGTVVTTTPTGHQYASRAPDPPG